MTLSNILYTLFIGPLELLFETIFSITFLFTQNAGLSIIVLSLCLNLILLPIYKRIDYIQEQDNKIRKKLEKGVEHIKSTFKGDEQYMILNTYYRQNNYSPIYALRGTLSLLIEIPFFIAAYNFLSNLSILKHSSFWIIQDLSLPDNLFFGINIIPIAMTIVNILSCLIYTNGKSIKNNIQLYLIAIVFLILLYNSSSALALYYTLNNMFSLIKNMLLKTKKQKLIISIMCSIIGLFVGIVSIIKLPDLTIAQFAVLICFSMLLQIPVFYSKFKINIRKKTSISKIEINNKVFYLSNIFLCLMLGLFIPCQVIGSSTFEFIDQISLIDPVLYIINSFLLSIGTFCFWMIVYYFLSSNIIKKILYISIYFICGIAVIDYMFFGTNLGTMSNKLIFNEIFVFSFEELILNIIILTIVCLIMYLIIINNKKACKLMLLSAITALLLISGLGIVKIEKESNKTIETYSENNNDFANIELSKNRENVVFIMIDAAIGSYFPYIINEDRNLINQFSGFTYYPNTVSFGGNTVFSTASIYGGYDYSPKKINERSNEKLIDKQVEALKVLPNIFGNSNYNVSVIDPCFADLSASDLSIYNDIPNVEQYYASGRFDVSVDGKEIPRDLSILNRNLFCYSVMKCSPLCLQSFLYNGGAYNSIDFYNSTYLLFGQEMTSLVTAEGVREGFAEEYAVLSNLSNITTVKNSDKKSFIMFYNQGPHENAMLQEPEYTISSNVDNTNFETDFSRKSIDGDIINFTNTKQVSYYHANIATLKKLGEWFDFLKQEDVYDNTRIIVVSDHGCSLGNFNNLIIDDPNYSFEIMRYNPLLLVKDYNSETFNIDNSFMCSADVPSLLMEGIIDNPINPYTGNKINTSIKEKEELSIYISPDPFTINDYIFTSNVWYKVKNNIFNVNNWSKEK